MFEQLFKMAPTITRHIERERFLEHYGRQGYPHTHLRQFAPGWGMSPWIQRTFVLKSTLEMKSKVLARLEISGTTRKHTPWHSAGLMEFLKAL